ncbi:hypothetical protein F4820DRAFT_442199 [Hypoxylon rubiginosum]|uniref:Uncharacterized protein n=1 Tax=Hypoxylon rubiginosum TaxID=110542 RepID=A0ACB9YGF3_9PEZI|nr:hypothetical protein F4820DRAFT_442199 [Hypoxylon rubiginosum]
MYLFLFVIFLRDLSRRLCPHCCACEHVTFGSVHRFWSPGKQALKCIVQNTYLGALPGVEAWGCFREVPRLAGLIFSTRVRNWERTSVSSSSF